MQYDLFGMPLPAQPAHRGESEWLDASLHRLEPYLRTHREFSSDDLYDHDLLAWQPDHHNAVGDLVRQAVARDWLSRSELRYVQSHRPAANRRKIAVRQSLIFEGRH